MVAIYVMVYFTYFLLPHSPPYGTSRETGGWGNKVLEHLYLYPYVHYESRDYYLPRYPPI